MSIRVVVADDQELIRNAFVRILDAEPDMDVVAEAANGAQAVDAVHAHRPDLLLLDIRMPVMDGIEAARRVCAGTSTRVLMLTTFDEDDYVYDTLRAGASGFLLKDVRGPQLVDAVRIVASGESLLAPAVTTRLIRQVVHDQQLGRPELHGLDALTPREREVLHHLGRGRSNAEIAESLVLSEHTVKAHVSNVLTKLGLRDRAQAVVAAYESGLIRPGG
jgi:DNA-binding NarL/FixJ family response regulator